MQPVLYREGLQNWQLLFYGQTVVEKHKSLPPGSDNRD